MKSNFNSHELSPQESQNNHGRADRTRKSKYVRFEAAIDRRLQEFEADQETSQTAINRNGKRPQLGYDRIANARRRQSIPDYEVKQSKKTPGR
ncbi:hypothetical protein HO133_009181 [Letharia lupina]|uniref:Uncharacterized protein n=1 Tax=Letharia lupina TaxID=560253 RepID=A0A8H6CMV2_9LECA|nr:uncharacterized protein HO133_009181 [Letharia lupina]KAF6226315.1 hypothetical protein HO133_009181 [Letharia lupina]